VSEVAGFDDILTGTCIGKFTMCRKFESSGGY
jgi:hypothetical protein